LGGLSPCLGPSWLAVKARGELRALALAQATERVAGLDPAVVGGDDDRKGHVRFPRAETRRVDRVPRA